jgi:hypothetical protein
VLFGRSNRRRARAPAFGTSHQRGDAEGIDREDGGDHGGDEQHKIGAAAVPQPTDAPHRGTGGGEDQEEAQGVDAAASGRGRVAGEHDVADGDRAVRYGDLPASQAPPLA